MEKTGLQTRISRNWLWLAIIVAGIGVYSLFDPMQNAWMPQCMFHKITGWQCMGCGFQRMVYALLHGDIPAAFRANMFLFFAMPFIAFYVWLEIKRLKYPRLYASLHSVGFIITATAMLVAWLFVRNYFGV